jgi:hypothetical protein
MKAVIVAAAVVAVLLPGIPSASAATRPASRPKAPAVSYLDLCSTDSSNVLCMRTSGLGNSYIDQDTLTYPSVYQGIETTFQEYVSDKTDTPFKSGTGLNTLDNGLGVYHIYFPAWDACVADAANNDEFILEPCTHSGTDFVAVPSGQAAGYVNVVATDNLGAPYVNDYACAIGVNGQTVISVPYALGGEPDFCMWVQRS